MMSRFENIPSISAMRRRSLDRSVAIDMPGNGEPCLRGRNVTFMHYPAMKGFPAGENRAGQDVSDGGASARIPVAAPLDRQSTPRTVWYRSERSRSQIIP